MFNIGSSLRLLAVTLALACGACSHPVVISPNLEQIPQAQTGKIGKNVGYYISPQNREKRVKTLGGGGDKIDYQPYAQMESGLYRVLSNVFDKVYVVKEMNDAEFIKRNEIKYIFVPTIETNSSSRNIMFWPPTDFSVTIDCSTVDGQTQQIWRTQVQADGGVVAVKDVLHDFGLAGRLASRNALTKLQSEIEAAPVFRQ